jgi:hypothetical protein
MRLELATHLLRPAVLRDNAIQCIG